MTTTGLLRLRALELVKQGRSGRYAGVIVDAAQDITERLRSPRPRRGPHTPRQHATTLKTAPSANTKRREPTTVETQSRFTKRTGRTTAARRADGPPRRLPRPAQRSHTARDRARLCPWGDDDVLPHIKVFIGPRDVTGPHPRRCDSCVPNRCTGSGTRTQPGAHHIRALERQQARPAPGSEDANRSHRAADADTALLLPPNPKRPPAAPRAIA